MMLSSRRLWACSPLAILIVMLQLAGPATADVVSINDAKATGGFTIIADNGGPLAEVTLHYLPDLHAELTPFLDDLLAALPVDVDVVVLCPSAAAAETFEQTWAETQRARGRCITTIDVDRPISVWARDRRIARETPADGHPTNGVIPRNIAEYDEEKRNDLFAYYALQTRGLVPPIDETFLELEGGNLVANGRHAFVGINTLTDNERHGHTHAAVTRELLRLFGRPFVAVHDLDQQTPWFHVDMFLTPVADDVILVGSPALGSMLISSDGRAIERLTELTELTETDIDCIVADERAARFDGVANQLADYGYKVLRLPVIADAAEDWMVSYNNVLMETRGDVRTVYLPQYGLPSLDRFAESLYRSLGFEVRPIDVSGIFPYGGAVRCLVNVTARQSVGRPTTVAAAPVATAPPPPTSPVFDETEPESSAAASTAEPAAGWMAFVPAGGFALALLIFCMRIVDVSLGTIRLICMARGHKTAAVTLGFFEVTVWVLGVSAVLVHLTNWLNIAAYAGGFTVGTAIGLLIEQKLALGAVTLTIISRKLGNEVADALRAADFRVTTLTGSGRNGQVALCIVVATRRAAPRAMKIAQVVDQDVIITVEDVRQASPRALGTHVPGKAPYGISAPAIVETAPEALRIAPEPAPTPQPEVA